MMIFAHRGAAGSRQQENTLGAFESARRAGFELETDARISADGRAVLVHDSTVRTALAVRRVHKRTAAQLAELGVLTIDDLYRALGTGFELSVDLKVAGAGALVLAAAERAGATEHLWLVSDRLDVLRRLRAASSTVRLVHESRPDEIGDRHDHSDRLAAAAITAQNTDVLGWHAEAVAYSHARGVLAFGSLANDRSRWERAVAFGLDALYTDRLELARAVLP